MSRFRLGIKDHLVGMCSSGILGVNLVLTPSQQSIDTPALVCRNVSLELCLSAVLDLEQRRTERWVGGRDGGMEG